MRSGVYSITNVLDGKMLIGYASNLTKRKSHHMNNLHKNCHTNSRLQNAVNKYGIENFIFEVLEEYDREDAISMENWWCYWLDTHNEKHGYNIKPTDNSGTPKQAEESKRKISEKAKGHRRNTPEQREALRQVLIKTVYLKDRAGNEIKFDSLVNAARYICSLLSLKEVSVKSALGKVLKQDSRLREIHGFRTRFENTEYKSLNCGQRKLRGAIMLDVNKNIVKEWDYLKEASYDMSLDYKMLHQACKEERFYKNYFWKFK